MKKRILSMLLAMAMLLGLMPLSVFAEATEQVVIAEPAEAAEAAAPTEAAEEVSLTAFYVNPLYADQMTEEDLQTAFAQNPPLYAGKAGSSGAGYYTTPADAAPALRQAMEQREAVVTVPYVIPAEVLNAEEGLRNLCIEIFEQAFAHTGVPTQGDYLRWHYSSWAVSLKGTWNTEHTAVNGDLSFTISYHSDAAQEAAVSTRVDALLAELNPTGSDYEKLKTVYDWMCDHITYDYTNLNNENYKLKFSAYAALINGTAVCQGYANLLYRLALEMGIDCRVIAGTSHGEGHAWNIAKMGGSYYNLDSTWDSSRTTYAYFLKSNANFDDHTRNSEYTTAAFNAAYPMGSSDYDPASEVPDNVIASGTCGENLTWVLTDDGVLTISGTGAMVDYWEEAPWYDYRGKITSAVVETGVTTIGDFAFLWCDGLTDITIPDSVTSIGYGAFVNCSSLQGIWVREGNPNYSSDESGVLFDKEKTTLLQCPGGIEGTYSIPGSVTSIGDWAFDSCQSLTNIIIPDNVTSIGDGAFLYCRSLSSITIPESVTSIGNYAFSDCYSLTSITIPESVTSIGNEAFYYCSSLTSITIPEGVTSIGERAFSSCESLTGITIPASVTSIGDWAFDYCSALTEITFAGDAPTIGEGVFEGDTATAYYPAGNATWTESVMQDYGGTITWEAVCSEHEWREWKVTTEPTCTEKGEETRTCGLCGVTEKRSLDALGHDYHSVVTAPTCTEKGYTTHTCTRCGDSYVDMYVDALGHKTALQNAKDATCTETGYTGDEICAVCGEIVKKGEAIAALGHDYQSEVTDPTCTEQGYSIHTCTRCGDSYVDTYVDALGHKTELKNAKEATCTETGYTGDEICTVCGETVQKGEAVAALGHSFGEWKQTKAPTCTEKGEETRTCSVCGVTEKREMAALGHKLTLVPGVTPDYAKPGMKEHYVCEVCGKLFADEAGTVEVTEEELVIPQLIQVENGKTEIGKEVIDSAAENVESGGEVKLPVADAGEVKRAELPVQSLTQVADKEASLTVEMTAATVTMDNAALEAVARQSGEQDAVTLEITEISKEDLTEAQQEAVKDKNVVNTISARLLVNDQPIASEADGGFGDGRVTVKIPFTPEAGTTAADYKVLYVADDGATAEIPTAYEDGCLVIVLEHFSDYVIVKTKTVMLGDINGDGKINVTDLMRLANFFAGKSEINAANSDLDGNGKVTVTDLMRLANVFAGKATLG